MTIYNKIFTQREKNKKIVLLIDPDKQNAQSLSKVISQAETSGVDAILFGGSLVRSSVDDFVKVIKENTNIPVILFPGSLLQISENADAILLLSLISGRNPEFLIGNQVIAAPLLQKSNLEIISSGYMLINGGKLTSVEYMSNTKPIPSDKADIAVATAIAGEMLGLKSIYLEAGSGALSHVPIDMIKQVRERISIPLIVGGGIKTAQSAQEICHAGADIIVVGTAAEQNSDILKEISDVVKGF